MIHETWVQAGLAPFLAGLVVALLFFKLRLGGLAVLAGVCAAAWLMGMLEVSTDTPRERIVLLTLAAAVLGLVADLAFHAGRLTAYVLGAAFGGAALWTFSASPRFCTDSRALSLRSRFGHFSGSHAGPFGRIS